MARYKGHEGELSVDTNTAAEVESFDLTIESAQLDANVMGSAWTDVEGGQKTATGTLSFLYDPADAAQAALGPGSDVALILYTVGNTTGLEQISGNFFINEITRTTSVGDLVKMTASIRNSGAVTVADVPV